MQAESPSSTAPKVVADPNLSRHVMGLYDEVFAAVTCAQWCERFDRDQALQPGRAGDKLDIAIKDSTDLHLSAQDAWQRDHLLLQEGFWQCLGLYLKSFPFLATSAQRSTVVLDDGTPYELTPQTVAQLDRDAGIALLRQLYQLSPIQVQRYRKGQGGFHRWHSEIYPSAQRPQVMQRVLFVLAYLNTVEVGGQTEFAMQGLRVKPITGRVLVAPCGFTHTHRGAVPQSADKYVATAWLSFHPVD